MIAKIQNLLIKASLAKNLSVPETDIEKSLKFFSKYPQFLNIRFFIANDNILASDAISKYVKYMKYLNSAGFIKNRDYIVESFKFIANYCVAHGISFGEYERYKEKNKEIEVWYIHVKDRNVSDYSLVFFPQITQKVLTGDQQDAIYYMESIETFYKKIVEVNSFNEEKKQFFKLKNTILQKTK